MPVVIGTTAFHCARCCDRTPRCLWHSYFKVSAHAKRIANRMAALAMRQPAVSPKRTVFGERYSRVLRAKSKAQKSVGAFEVLAFGGINADDLAFINEGRHLHHHAGFQGGGLGHVGR